jgi:hypothetical protein
MSVVACIHFLYGAHNKTTVHIWSVLQEKCMYICVDRVCLLVNLAVYEVFERMAYYGISSNLVLYLTKQLHQGTVLSANNVTNWVGTIWMTPIIGAYIADAHLGRYRTFMVASVIYLLVSFSCHLGVALSSLRHTSRLSSRSAMAARGSRSVRKEQIENVIRFRVLLLLGVIRVHRTQWLDFSM